MPAMRAISRRRYWSRPHRPISRCSTARRARPPAAAPTRCCRNARIISMPASIRRFPSNARQHRRKIAHSLDLGIDAYYKIATDLIDNGNFGQALVLSAFNYAKGVVEGIEFSGKYHAGNFQAYANLAVGQEKATECRVEPVSVRQCHATGRPRRLDRAAIHRQPLDLHRSHPDRDRFGRCLLPILRPAIRCPARRGGTRCAGRPSAPT